VTGESGAEDVVERYQRQADERNNQSGDSDSEQSGWKGLLSRRVRPGLIVGVGLAVLQQFVGINTVLYFAPTIMEQTGLSASNSIIYSVIIGVVNLAMTIVSLRLIDRVGRSPLLMVSFIGMCIAVAGLVFSFLILIIPVLLIIFLLVFFSSFIIWLY